MMETLALAGTVVELVTPLLKEAAQRGAASIGEGAGKKALDWLAAHLGSSGKEALDDLTKRPNDADEQASLRKAIRKLLEADPSLAHDLHAIVEEARRELGVANRSTTIQKGNHNKSATIIGEGSKIDIR